MSAGVHFVISVHRPPYDFTSFETDPLLFGGNEGEILFRFAVSDPDNHRVHFKLFHTVDNGAIWNRLYSFVNLSGEYSTGNYHFIWRSTGDVHQNSDQVKIAMVPIDYYESGVTAESGLFSVANNSVAAVSNLNVTGDSQEIQLTFNLAEPNGDTCSIRLAYSTDDGYTYTDATQYSGDVTSLLPGTGYSINWNSYQDIQTDLAGVNLRLIPNDGQSDGAFGQSIPITIHNNHLPEITNVSASGNSKEITVSYTLNDQDEHTCSVALYYQIDEGDFIKSTHLTGTTEQLANGNHEVVWDSYQEIKRNEGSVKIKLVASDLVGNGQPSLSQSFALNNNTPPIIQNVATSSSSDQILVTYDLVDPEQNLQQLTFEYRVSESSEFLPMLNVDDRFTNSVYVGSRNFLWRSLKGFITQQNNVQFRITANDGQNNGSTVSNIFQINNKLVPVLTTTSIVGTTRDIKVSLAVHNDVLTMESIQLEYSLDNGNTFQPVQSFTPDLTKINDHQLSFIWQSYNDFQTKEEAVKLRITPADVAGSGFPLITETFAVNNNQIPVVAVTELLGDTGDITVRYDLNDGDNQLTNLKFAYSFNGGATYIESTNITGQTSEVTNGVHELTWHSGIDVSALQSYVIAKITANDGFDDGSGETEIFQVLNNHPPVISNVQVVGTSGEVQITYDLFDADGDTSDVMLSYSKSDQEGFITTKKITGDTASLVSGNSYQITWNSESDIVYDSSLTLKLTAQDITNISQPAIVEGQLINNNHAPVISNMKLYHQDSQVGIAIDLADFDEDLCSLTYQYSTDEVNFIEMSEIYGEKINVSNRKNHITYWTPSEVGNFDGSVEIKVTISDGHAAGNSLVSEKFPVTYSGLPVLNIIDHISPTEDGIVQVNYKLTDPNQDTCSVRIYFSTDGGTNFAYATTLFDVLTTDSNAIHTAQWHSTDEVHTNQPSVLVKLLPYDDSGTGISDHTDSFSLNNAIDLISSKVNITWLADNAGVYKFSYKITSEVYFPHSVEGQYSVDQGATWQSMKTTEGVKENLNPSDYTEYFLDWFSATDFQANGTITVRLRPYITLTNGGYTETHYGQDDSREIYINNQSLPKVSIDDIIVVDYEKITVKYSVDHHGPWKIKPYWSRYGGPWVAFSSEQLAGVTNGIGHSVYNGQFEIVDLNHQSGDFRIKVESSQDIENGRSGNTVVSESTKVHFNEQAFIYLIDNQMNEELESGLKVISPTEAEIKFRIYDSQLDFCQVEISDDPTFNTQFPGDVFTPNIDTTLFRGTTREYYTIKFNPSQLLNDKIKAKFYIRTRDTVPYTAAEYSSNSEEDSVNVINQTDVPADLPPTGNSKQSNVASWDNMEYCLPETDNLAINDVKILLPDPEGGTAEIEVADGQTITNGKVICRYDLDDNIQTEHMISVTSDNISIIEDQIALPGTHQFDWDYALTSYSYKVRDIQFTLSPKVYSSEGEDGKSVNFTMDCMGYGGPVLTKWQDTYYKMDNQGLNRRALDEAGVATYNSQYSVKCDTQDSFHDGAVTRIDRMSGDELPLTNRYRDQLYAITGSNGRVARLSSEIIYHTHSRVFGENQNHSTTYLYRNDPTGSTLEIDLMVQPEHSIPPDVSPDGTTVLVRTSNNTLVTGLVVDTDHDGFVDQPLSKIISGKTINSARFNFDGSKIIYSWQDGQTSNISLINPDGSGEELIAQFNGVAYQCTLADTGNELVFTDIQFIYRYTIDEDTAPVKIAPGTVANWYMTPQADNKVLPRITNGRILDDEGNVTMDREFLLGDIRFAYDIDHGNVEPAGIQVFYSITKSPNGEWLDWEETANYTVVSDTEIVWHADTDLSDTDYIRSKIRVRPLYRASPLHKDSTTADIATIDFINLEKVVIHLYQNDVDQNIFDGKQENVKYTFVHYSPKVETNQVYTDNLQVPDEGSIIPKNEISIDIACYLPQKDGTKIYLLNTDKYITWKVIKRDYKGKYIEEINGNTARIEDESIVRNMPYTYEFDLLLENGPFTKTFKAKLYVVGVVFDASVGPQNIPMFNTVGPAPFYTDNSECNQTVDPTVKNGTGYYGNFGIKADWLSGPANGSSGVTDPNLSTDTNPRFTHLNGMVIRGNVVPFESLNELDEVQFSFMRLGTTLSFSNHKKIILNSNLSPLVKISDSWKLDTENRVLRNNPFQKLSDFQLHFLSVEERLEYENDLFKRQMFPSTNYKTEILPNPAINYPDHPSSDFPSRNFVDNVPSLKYGSIYCCDTPGLGNPIARKYNSSDDSAKFDQFVQWVNLDFTPKQNGKRRQNIKFKISNNIYWCSSVVITDASTVLNLLRSYTRLHRLGKLIGDPNKIILGKFKNENWHNSKSVEEVVKWLLEIE